MEQDEAWEEALPRVETVLKSTRLGKLEKFFFSWLTNGFIRQYPPTVLESSGAQIWARIRSTESSRWTAAAPTASTEAFWGVNADVELSPATSRDQKGPLAL